MTWWLWLLLGVFIGVGGTIGTLLYALRDYEAYRP